MDYLLLWSGAVRGMRKARIPSTPAPGMIGHIGPLGLVNPDPAAVRAALPYRFRKAFDRAGPYFWYDKYARVGPAVLRLSDRRGKPLVTVYLQPLTAEEENRQ
jgi:hypothetical protein